ncbi:MAG: NfeD family protein [Chloroflexi bacterium]|nr:MAG: NfeD family protein [Chloroflexota bacterium]
MFDGSSNALLLWGWIVMALIFFTAEIFTAGFVLLCFGIGALAGAGMAFFGLGLAWQLVAFIVASSVAVLLSRPFAERVSSKSPQNVAGDRVLGKRAVVLQAIDPIANTGIVRVGTEEWRAESVDQTGVPKDSLVEVVGVAGVRLQVRRITDSTEQTNQPINRSTS